MAVRIWILSILSSLVLLSGCTKDSSNPTGPTSPVDGSSHRGYITFIHPAAGETFDIDSLMTLQWTSTRLDSNDYVNIYLYRADTLISSLVTVLANDGDYILNTPMVLPANYYRIKIMNTYDTTQYDFSTYFSIHSDFPVYSPNASSAFATSTTMPVLWSPANLGSNTSVSVRLFREDTLVYTLATTTSNDGSYSPSAPSVAVGNRYRIQVMGTSDTSRRIFSDYFRLGTSYAGTITVTAPLTGDTLTIGSSYSFQWTNTGTIGSYVVIQLFSDTTLAATVSSSRYNSGNYTLPTVSTSQGSGNRYRLRIYAYSDSTIQAWSGYFTLQSQYNGGFSFISPDSSTVWAAGSAYTVQWNTTGTPGAYYNLDVYRNDSLQQSIVSGSTNTGSRSWPIPAYLLTGEYRLKVSSYYDAGIFTFSDTFSIAGMSRDAFELDSGRSIAKPHPVGDSLYYHTLTYEPMTSGSDTDWVSFDAVKGVAYLIRNPGTCFTYLTLYRGSSLTTLTYLIGGTFTSTPYLTWTADSTCTHYARINTYSGSNSGTYQFGVTAVDSLSLVTFTSPTRDSIWSTGTPHVIRWATDSTLFSTYVYVYLCSDTSVIYNPYGSYMIDNGLYTWTLPGTLASGGRYRIKVMDRTNTKFFAFSDTFTIGSTIPADVYETDNLKSQARAITVDGTPQNRSMSLSDSDWVSFSAQKDTLYVISAQGYPMPQLGLYLYSATSTSYLSYAGYSSPKIAFKCTTSATYYVKAVPYSTSGTSYGVYQLSIRAYPATSLNRFTDPNALTAWSTGSAYSINWSPDTALFGANVNLSLYRGNRLVMAIATGTANDGLNNWAPVTGLASAGNYRLLLASNSNTQISGFSDTFTISGIAPDNAEPDDTVSQAAVVSAFGTPLSRTLAYGDADWSRFTAQNRFLYKIVTTGTVYPRLDLLSTDGVTVLASDNILGASANAQISWLSAAAGNYFLKVSPAAGAYGSYQITVTEYDTAAYRFSVTAPAVGDTARPGTPLPILWTDPVGLGGSVDIFLYNGSGIVETVVSGSTNDGTHSWTVTATLPPRDDYYLRVISRTSSTIYGNSAVFSIR